MICRTSVQDRLKIRLDALVELPFRNSSCYALVRSPLARACGMSAATLADEPQSTILARAANRLAAFSRADLIITYGAEYPRPDLLEHLAVPGCSKIRNQWNRCGVYYLNPIGVRGQ